MFSFPWMWLEGLDRQLATGKEHVKTVIIQKLKLFNLAGCGGKS